MSGIGATGTALLIASVTAGCYRYVPAARTGTEPVQKSERVIARERVLQLESLPTPTQPTVRLSLGDNVTTTFQERSVHSANKVASRGWNLFGGVFWLGAGSVGILEAERQIRADGARTRHSKWYGGLGTAAVLGSLYLFAKAGDKDVHPAPNKRLYGEPSLVTRVRFVGGAKQALNVEFSGFRRSLPTNDSGVVEFDLVRDLGMDTVGAPRQVTLRATTNSLPRPLELTLDSRRWLPACARTTGSGVIRASPNGQSADIGQFAVGTRYWLTDEPRPNWISVGVGQGSGWIPRAVATLCWESPLRAPR